MLGRAPMRFEFSAQGVSIDGYRYILNAVLLLIIACRSLSSTISTLNLASVWADGRHTIWYQIMYLRRYRFLAMSLVFCWRWSPLVLFASAWVGYVQFDKYWIALISGQQDDVLTNGVSYQLLDGVRIVSRSLDLAVTDIEKLSS
jgi:hypothetical protein